MREPEYSGKPLAYLDQNILDGFLNCIETEPDFVQGFLERVQVVYSNITLQEIYRAGIKDTKYSDEFLVLLDQFDAIYIEAEFDEHFKFTGKMKLLLGSAKVIYENYINESLKYDEFINPLQKTIFAMYGGVKDYEDMENSQIESQYSLLKFIEDQINNLKNEKIDHPFFNLFIQEKENELDSLRKQMSDFEKNMKNNTNHLKQINTETDAHLAFRKELKINIDEINKIQSPDVLTKLWETLRKSNSSLDEIQLDDFLQIRNVKHSFEKIHVMYTNLNLMGFRPEKKVKNEKKFISSQSDISHVAYASYCDYFITNDERLADKSDAIYEYLEIPTEILNIPKFLDK